MGYKKKNFHSPRVGSFIGFTYSVLWHFARMPAFTIPLFNLDDGAIYRCLSGVPIRLRP